MDNRLQELNTLFVDTFDAIMRVEEKSLKHVGGGKLSISEFHTLECIGGGEDARRTVGEIAEALNVTVPTVTVCVNKLVKKGYATKTRSEKVSPPNGNMAGKRFSGSERSAIQRNGA